MPGPGEPLWLAEDRAWALALLEVEADACPDCGQPWGEATSKANEFRYTADVVRCHACAAGARTMQQFEDAGGDPRGLHVHIHHPESRG